MLHVIPSHQSRPSDDPIFALNKEATQRKARGSDSLPYRPTTRPMLSMSCATLKPVPSPASRLIVPFSQMKARRDPSDVEV